MTTFERVKQILVEHLVIDPKYVTEDARLIQDLECDSLDYVEIATKVEDEFGIEINDDDWYGVLTVSDAVKLIERLAVPA